MSNIQKVRGTNDIMPDQSMRWANVETLIRSLCKVFNYKEIRTPIIESTDLFVRGVGASTDIVNKEMYTFSDKKGRSITLRPEGTASVVRAYVENKYYDESNYLKPAKLFYIAPMFRYERPQKGRYRQHHQFGVEVLGTNEPRIDAEVISLGYSLFRFLGLKDITVKLNTLGDNESRDSYRRALKSYMQDHLDDLCDDCKSRLELNPLRILDCKIDGDKDVIKKAPKMSDYLNESSQTFFNNLKAELELLGIKYELDENLVRGLDYYNHTVFEIHADIEGFGANVALGGGGRYNGLVEEIGGPETPGIGFGFGLERLLEVLDAEGLDINGQEEIDLYLIPIGEKATKVVSVIQNQLRMYGFIVDTDYLNRSVKSQFKQADKMNARFVGVLGDDELKDKVINIRNNHTKEEASVEIEKIAEHIDKMSHHQDDHECCGNHDHGDDHECQCGHHH